MLVGLYFKRNPRQKTRRGHILCNGYRKIDVFMYFPSYTCVIDIDFFKRYFASKRYVPLIFIKQLG